MDEVQALRKKKQHAEAAEQLRKLPKTFEASGEWAVISYYIGEVDSGAFHSTLAVVGPPRGAAPANKIGVGQELVLQNASWYAQKLNISSWISLSPAEMKPPFVPTNPSLLAIPGGWLACVRTVNYRQKGVKTWYVLKSPAITSYRNINYLLWLKRAAKGGQPLSESLKVVAQQVIADPSQVKQRPAFGMEDIRIYGNPWPIQASFTLINNSHRDRHGNAVGVTSIGADGQCADVVELPSLLRQLKEKNWLPFQFRGKQAFLYSYSPLRVLDRNGSVVLVKACPYDLSSFRGSAIAEYRGGFLVVVHELAIFPEEYIYTHRFVKYSADFDLVDISRQFVFDHRGVEFCCGMVPDEEGVLLGFGVEDRDARVALVSFATIEASWLDFSAKVEAYLGIKRDDVPTARLCSTPTVSSPPLADVAFYAFASGGRDRMAERFAYFAPLEWVSEAAGTPSANTASTPATGRLDTLSRFLASPARYAVFIEGAVYLRRDFATLLIRAIEGYERLGLDVLLLSPMPGQSPPREPAAAPKECDAIPIEVPISFFSFAAPARDSSAQMYLFGKAAAGRIMAAFADPENAYGMWSAERSIANFGRKAFLLPPLALEDKGCETAQKELQACDPRLYF